jgi:molecular chaperone GrpE
LGTAMKHEESPLADNLEETVQASIDESQAAEKLVESDFRALQAQIQTLSSERDQFQNQLLRTMADFQNFRRRSDAENAHRGMLATEKFVTKLLPVLDNFERTLQHAEAGLSVEALVDGIRAVERQLRQVLEGQGVSRIESTGKPFDPELHEAISFESDPEKEPNTVTTELEAGYRMGDRVVRPARVKVAGG